MLVTLILIAALLAGVAILVSLQLTTTKATELTRSGLASLHCAEAGLSIAHKHVGSNRAGVTAWLASNPNDTTNEPSLFYAAGTPANFLTGKNDLDGDGSVDFRVFIIDNDDEATPDADTDSDRRVWLIARCIKYPDTPKEVRELIEFDPTPTRYEWQEGRAFGNSNANAYN